MAKRRLPKFLHGDEPDRLLASAACERDRVIMLLLRYLGLRVSEACHLRIEDIDRDEGSLMVQHGKGDKDRQLPIPRKLAGPLYAWIGAREAGWLFPSPYKPGKPLTRRAVGYQVVKSAQRAEIRRTVSPHKLRHTFATNALDAGATLREVQELLGHSSVATTEIYTWVQTDRLRGAVDRV